MKNRHYESHGDGNSQLDDPLLAHLASLPQNLDFLWGNSPLLKANVHRALNTALAGVDWKYGEAIFRGLDRDKFANSWQTEQLVQKTVEKGQFFGDLKSKNDIHYTHKGPCGRAFGEGEPVYRCKECSFDNTCVLCVHCFNKKDHEGHLIRVSIAADDNQGYCDCGDSEAWTSELHCKAMESVKSEANSDEANIGEAKSEVYLQSEEFKHHLDQLVSLLLNYIVGTFHYAHDSLSFFVRDNASLDRFEFQDQIESHSRRSWLFDNFGIAPPENDSFLLLMWNDEDHSFDKALDYLRRAGASSLDKRKELAFTSDEEGRSVVCTEAKPISLYDGFKALTAADYSSEGMVGTVTSSYQFMQQQICLHIVEWLTDLLNHSSTALQDAASEALISCLLREKSAFLDDEMYFYSPSDRFKRSILCPNEKIQLKLDNSLHNITNVVLDYLLFFDIRFFKKLRVDLQNMLLGLAFKHPQFKLAFAERFASIYPAMIQNMSVEREPDLNIRINVQVQILTSPSSIVKLVGQGLDANFVSGITDLLKKQTILGNFRPSFADWNPIDAKVYVGSLLSAFFDLTQIWEATPLSHRYKLYSTPNMSILLDLLWLLQNGCPFKRKTNTHVETEDTSFHFGIQILNPVLCLLSSGYNGAEFSQGATDLKGLLTFILDAYNVHVERYPLVERSFVSSDYSVQNFSISTESVSLMNPTNSLISLLIENNNIDLFNSVVTDKLSADSITSYREIFEGAARKSLISIVFCSQVASRFWVRNGDKIGRYVTIYSQLAAGHNTSAHGYFRDFHLVQLALYLNPDFIFEIISTWELNKSFDGDEVTEGIYGDKFLYLIREFMLFFYRLLTERKSFFLQTSQEKKRSSFYYWVLYLLGTGPEKYSHMVRYITVDDNDETLSSVLDEVAEFNPPVGMSDSGTFNLKSEYFDSLDPFSFFSSSTEELSSNIKHQIFKRESKKGTNLKSPEDVVLKPHFPKLENDYRNYTRFLQNEDFQKIFIMLLKWCSKNRDTYCITICLHILYAIVIDNINNGVKQTKFYNTISEILIEIRENPETHKETKLTAVAIFQLICDSILEGKTLPNDMITSSIEEASVNEKQLRKAKIEEKKRKAFEKLAAQRKKFEENNHKSDNTSVNEQDDDSGSVANSTRYARTCITCQLEQKNTDVFVILAQFSNHNLPSITSSKSIALKQTLSLWSNSVSLEDFKNEDGSLITNDKLFKTYPNISSCNHAQHLRCANQHGRRCPMCGFQGKFLIPIHMTEKLRPGFLTRILEQESSMDSIEGLHSLESYKAPKPGSSILEELFSDYSDLYSESSDVSQSFKSKNDVINLKILLNERRNWDLEGRNWVTSLLESKLTILEISGRFAVGDTNPYADYLDEVPDIAYSFLKSLMFVKMLSDRFSPPKEEDFKLKSSFFIFIQGFLSGNYSFSYIVKSMYYREIGWIMKGIFGLIAMNDKLFGFIESLGDCYQSKDKVDTLALQLAISKLIKPEADELLNGLGTNFLKGMLYVISKCLLTFFRKILLFLRVLAFDNDSDISFKTIRNRIDDEILDKIRDDIDRPDTIAPYLDFFKLESIPKVIVDSTTTEGVAHLLFKERFGEEEPNNNGCLLEYPGVIKLIPLPKRFDIFATSPNEFFDALKIKRSPESANSVRFDFHICLHCGAQVFNSRHEKFSDIPATVVLNTHFKEHVGHSIFFDPCKNVFRILYKLTFNGSKTSISSQDAPYMDIMGESGSISILSNSLVTLNENRYRNIIKKYLSDGLISDMLRQPNASDIFAGDQVVTDQYWTVLRRNVAILVAARNGGATRAIGDDPEDIQALIRPVVDEDEWNDQGLAEGQLGLDDLLGNLLMNAPRVTTQRNDEDSSDDEDAADENYGFGFPITDYLRRTPVERGPTTLHGRDLAEAFENREETDEDEEEYDGNDSDDSDESRSASYVAAYDTAGMILDGTVDYSDSDEMEEEEEEEEEFESSGSDHHSYHDPLPDSNDHHETEDHEEVDNSGTENYETADGGSSSAHEPNDYGESYNQSSISGMDNYPGSTSAHRPSSIHGHDHDHDSSTAHELESNAPSYGSPEISDYGSDTYDHGHSYDSSDDDEDPEYNEHGDYDFDEDGNYEYDDDDDGYYS